MPEHLQSFIKSASAALSQIELKSAMNPYLWFAGIVFLGGFATLACVQDAIVTYVMLGFMGFVIVCGVGFFGYFAVCKPDFLRSEKYQLQKQSIEMLGTKAEQLSSSADHLVAIANPARPESGA